MRAAAKALGVGGLSQELERLLEAAEAAGNEESELDQIRELFWMARGEEDLVSGLRPPKTDRPSDQSRADDPDLQASLLRPNRPKPFWQDRWREGQSGCRRPRPEKKVTT